MHLDTYPYECINTIRSATCEFTYVYAYTRKKRIYTKNILKNIYKKYKGHMKVCKLRLWFDVVC